MRIAALLPAATEIVYALGLGDALVAVTHECDYPPEARGKRVVTRSILGDSNRLASGEIDRQIGAALSEGQGLYHLDRAALRAADPTVIITQALCDVCAVAYGEVQAAVAQLDPGPPRRIVSLTPNRLADLYDGLRAVGAATGREAAAAALVASLQARVARIAAAPPAMAERPGVCLIEWLDPLMVSGNWLPELVALAGGRPLLGQAGHTSKKHSWQEVVAAAPAVLVLIPCGFPVERTLEERALLESLPGWADLPAVRQDRVWVADGNAYFNRPGPRLVESLEILAGVIQPERFSELVPKGAAVRL